MATVSKVLNLQVLCLNDWYKELQLLLYRNNEIKMVTNKWNSEGYGSCFAVQKTVQNCITTRQTETKVS